MFPDPWVKKNDEEIMLRVQQQDPRALTEIYRRYSGKIVRYFHRMLWRDEKMAQDFLQDLFVKIIERPQRFDPERRFSTWIYSVAFNMCKNEYRKQSFRRASLHSAEAVDEAVQPEVEQMEFVKTLEKVLGQSDEDDKNLFVLRYELDMPLAEIAVLTGCPEGTVKSRLFYLKRKLAQQMQEYDPSIK